MLRLPLTIAVAVLLSACGGEFGERCSEEKDDCRDDLQCLYIWVVGQEGAAGAGGTRCTTECSSDADCDEGVCGSDRLCVPSCTADSDCLPGSACLAGQCALTCATSDDCKAGTCEAPGGFCSQ